MKWALLSLLALLSVGSSILLIRYLRKPRFPWQDLVLEETNLSSSLDFNPYADMPPAHRWEIGMRFKKFVLKPDRRFDGPIITYTLDLGRHGWSQLPGTYDLSSSNGSDFWHGDDDLGPVYLEKIEIRPGKGARFAVVMDLAFEFEDGSYRPEKKQFTFSTNYAGLQFTVPTWNEPQKVAFPPAWGIPSAKPHWTNQEIQTFVGKYVDLSQYRDLEIDQSKSASLIEAKPK